MLYHVSEEDGIERFEPRTAKGLDSPVVWAIDESKLRNYLLPRDCPRVTFFAGMKTTAEDVERFLDASEVVIAIESAWLDRLRRVKLFCYQLPAETFECVDECAGYFHSRVPVTPIGVRVVDDALGELVSRGVELRVTPSLWELHDRVIASTLSYSIIRMRNAGLRVVLSQD